MNIGGDLLTGTILKKITLYFDSVAAVLFATAVLFLLSYWYNGRKEQSNRGNTF